MNNLPEEFQGEERKILYSRKLSPEVKNQIIASIRAIVETAFEYLPDVNLSPEQMRTVYYEQILKGYNPKFGDMQKEVGWQVYTELEKSNLMYFPPECAEYTKKYILSNAFENNYQFHVKHINRNVIRNFSSDRSGRHNTSIVHEEMFKRGFESQVDEIRHRILMNYPGSLWKISGSVYRNWWDRVNYMLELNRKLARRDSTTKTPLLIKKRNKQESPSSVRQAVKEMTARGLKQREIALRLEVSERWVRKIQKEFKE